MRPTIQQLAAEPEVQAALQLVPRDSPLPIAPSLTMEDRVAKLERQITGLEKLCALRIRQDELRSERHRLHLTHPDCIRALEIIREVLAGQSDYTLEDLRSAKRSAYICSVRFEYYRRARAAGIPIGAIGHLLHRTHGSVIDGLKRHGVKP